MFRATPALPALLVCWCRVSKYASQGSKESEAKTLMALDLCKGSPCGDMEHEVSDEVSEGLHGESTDILRGCHEKGNYGVRDAPKVWPKNVKQMLEQGGFRQLVCTLCTFSQPCVWIAGVGT